MFWFFWGAVIIFFGFSFWMAQFFNMMSGKDENFPGRYDKIIWGMLFVFGNIFGAVAWCFYIPPSQEESEGKSDSVVLDISE